MKIAKPIQFGLSAFMVAVLVGFAPLVHADSLSEGVALYKAKLYARAAQKLETALKASPTAEGVFYLGMAYSHLNRFDEAHDAFEHVIQMAAPSSKLAEMARNNINYVTKQQITLASSSGKANQVLSASLSRSSRDNYLTYVLYRGKVIHFSTDKMPLKVFISDGRGVPGWNSGLKQSVNYAMRAWQSASHGRVYFSQVYNEANADIVVRWRKNFSDGILGVSPLQTVGDTIVQSDVNLATYYPDRNAPIPFEDLKSIAVHELGHAIGLRGHSPNPDDIMFFSKTRQANTLSARDINTIGMLYKLQADVQNAGSGSTSQTKRYYELYQQGLKAQTSGQVNAAMSAYRQAIQLSPAKSEAKFNLGALLINQGSKLAQNSNYTEARNYFLEARQLYSQIVQSPNPPQGAQENLSVADSNLSQVNRLLGQ
jgi:tetratricopeptide (TPR) repeat protein